MNRVRHKLILLSVLLITALTATGCGPKTAGFSGENGSAPEQPKVTEPENAPSGAANSRQAADSGQEADSSRTASPEQEAAPSQTVSPGQAANPGQDAASEADEQETAAEAVENIRIGWNLGNSLDSTGNWILQSTKGTVEDFETAWGNPVTPPTLMQKLKSLGLQAVRIPITWNYHFDEDGNIDAQWMTRVKEIVDWAMETDLYCIINIHHDTGADGWLRASKANYEENSALYARLWEQIAGEFKDYPDLLLFEGFNEMLDEKSEWNRPNAEAIEVINQYNQLFVDTVRGTGEKNAARNLICCTYAAATTDSVIDGFQLPEDRVPGHLIAEVHFYAPYEFITEEGVTWTTPISEYTDYVEQQIDAVFARLSKRFTDEDIPLIVGEFACDDKDNTEDRIKWYTHVIEQANELQAACFLWDNGNGFCMGHIDRTGEEDAFPQILEACVETAR